MKKKNKYLIIGNSAAAVGAVEAIRQNDKDGKITLVSDEPYSTYSRPLISYLLAGKVSKEKMFYRDNFFYRKNKIEAILGQKAKKIDLKERKVKLDNGKQIHFTRLLIATGGKPVTPEIAGSNLPGTFTFTTWDEANEIKKFIDKYKVKKAVVIGGGLIGLKAAEALIELKIKVTIVELADRILNSTFDKKASGLVEKALKEADCRVVTGNTVDLIENKKGKKVDGVILKNGKKLPADLVILAIGVSPNMDIVKGSRIKTNRGIIVDNFMKTNVGYVYAAGDVAEAYDFLLGISRPVPIWPNAYRQGKIAGHNMSYPSGASPKEYSGSLAMNSVEICDVPTVSVGITDLSTKDKCEILQEYEPEQQYYKKIVLKNNRVIGAIFINDIDRAGIITGLIKDKVDVSEFKEHLMRKDFGLVYLPETYRKHLVRGAGIEV